MYSSSNITPRSYVPIPPVKQVSIPENIPVARLGGAGNNNLSPVPDFAKDEYESTSGPTFDLGKIKECLTLNMPFNAVAWSYGIRIETLDYQFLQMIAGKSSAQDVTLKGKSYLTVARNFGLKRRDDDFVKLQMIAVNSEGEPSIRQGESWQSIAARLELEPGEKAFDKLQMLAFEIKAEPRVRKGESWHSVANEFAFTPQGEAYGKLQKLALDIVAKEPIFNNQRFHMVAEKRGIKRGDPAYVHLLDMARHKIIRQVMKGDDCDRIDYSSHCAAMLFELDVEEYDIPQEEFLKTKQRYIDLHRKHIEALMIMRKEE